MGLKSSQKFKKLYFYMNKFVTLYIIRFTFRVKDITDSKYINKTIALKIAANDSNSAIDSGKQYYKDCLSEIYDIAIYERCAILNTEKIILSI